MEQWSDYWDAIGPRARTAANLAKTSTVESLFDIGLQWRLGNFYLSAMREIELVMKLRSAHGWDVNYHILADAEFKADAWIRTATGVVRVAALLINSSYFERKAAATVRLPTPTFEVRTFRIDKENIWGAYWSIKEETVREVCSFFGGHPCPH
jgi:hypothetical protein